MPLQATSAPRTSGRLESLLRGGQFAVSAETTPPDSADPEAVLRRAGCLQGLREIKGVAGAHLMAPRAEEAIARLIEDSGILAARCAA